MECNKAENLKEQSRSMFSEVCDTTSLISINLEELTLKAVVDKFLDSKASKTDLNVLIQLMVFWDKETSFIYIESFDFFRLKTGVELANANLSRAIKSLEEKGFISKVECQNKLEYLFCIPFEILKQNY